VLYANLRECVFFAYVSQDVAIGGTITLQSWKVQMGLGRTKDFVYHRRYVQRGSPDETKD
jgi:hypothetical protein